MKKNRFHLICALTGSCTALWAAPLNEGVLFHAPFEPENPVAYAEGSRQPQKEPAFTPGGRLGSGVKIEGEPLRFNNVANLDLRAGTVAFWVKPAWDGATKQDEWTLFRAVHLNGAYTAHSKVLFFMTGTTIPEKGFVWDYSTATNRVNQWKRDEWHHVAFTWNRDTGEKAIWIDGEPAVRQKGKYFPTSISSSAPIEFGINAPGVYDEITIWNRPLSASEISRLAVKPEEAARELAGNMESAQPPKPEAAPLLEQLSFYASLQNSTAPDRSTGTFRNQQKTPAAFASGIVGNGAKLARVDFNSNDVVDPAAGTVSFWFRPGPEWLDRKGNFHYFRAGHLALTLFPDGISFMTGRTDDGKFHWDYSCGTSSIRSWKPGEWHHFAVTWDRNAQQKAIWLDGELAKMSKTTVFPDRIQPEGEFIFAEFPGEYDEFAVWTRALAPAEIAKLCGYPELIPEGLGLVAEPVERTLPMQYKCRRKLAEGTDPAAALKLPLRELSPESTVVKPGEPFHAVIRIENHSLNPVELPLTVTLRNFHMEPVATETVPLRLDANAVTELNRAFTVQKRGIYKVEVAFPGKDGKSCIRDVASFGCWEKRQEPDPDSFFGNHVNSWAEGAFLRQAAKLGLNWMRNHNMLQATWWEHAQPKPGPFEWRGDAVLKELRELNMPVLGQLFTTPNWAAAGGPRPESKGYNSCFRPDPAAFETYVYETVKRYRGQIRYWEIWNEPDVSMFWKGTPEEFAELVQIAVRAARRADPEAKIMAAGFPTVARVWHRRAAKAGALKNLDILSIHIYAGQQEPEAKLEKIQDALNHFNALLKEYGDGRELPVWDSEGGVESTTFLRGVDFPLIAPEGKRPPQNWRETAIGTVQFEAILQMLGIEKNFMYFQNRIGPDHNEAYSNLSTLDVNNAPKPYLMARAAMQEQLDYTKFFRAIRRENQRFWALVFRHKSDPAQSRVLFWCGPEGKMELRTTWPGGGKRIDLMGNDLPFDPAGPVPVTEEPAYLALNAAAEDVAHALEKAELAVENPSRPYVPEHVDTGHGVPLLPDYSAPAEAPSKLFTVDLRSFCNMGLADEVAGDGRGGWADEGDLNDMRDLKTGRRTFYGVPFDLIDPTSNNGRAVITLKSRNLTPKLPEAVNGIPVNRKVRNLYFLQSASWGTPGVIGSYVIHYADGESVEIEMDIPKNNNNWWFGYDPKEESRPIPVQVSNTMTGIPAWRYLRMFEWQNPRTDVEIQSIDVRSRSGHQTPIVLAISGVAM